MLLILRHQKRAQWVVLRGRKPNISSHMQLLVNWLVATLVIIAVAYVLPGVTITSFTTALVAALVLGIINAALRPVLMFLALPINYVTLGLFTFVVNALLLLLVSAIVPGFGIANFWWALLFSLIIALVNGMFKGELKVGQS